MRKDSANLKATQVLLTEADRQLTRRLQERRLVLGTDGGDIPGPTTLHRAGLRALEGCDDETFLRLLNYVEGRMTMETLRNDFDNWCERIGDAVAAADPSLEYAHEARLISHRLAAERADENFVSRVGHFTNQARFAILSLMQDGRVQFFGMEVAMASIPAGQAMPRARPLFPGGLAVMLSLNGEGAALAVRAIVAWLLRRDSELPEIRAALSRHQAQQLR